MDLNGHVILLHSVRIHILSVSMGYLAPWSRLCHGTMLCPMDYDVYLHRSWRYDRSHWILAYPNFSSSNSRLWPVSWKYKLTAMEYHFATQCLPGPLAWHAHQLHPFLLCFLSALSIEVPATFLLIAPIYELQWIGAILQVALQIMIVLPGNYNFFNLLTCLEGNPSTPTKNSGNCHSAAFSSICGYGMRKQEYKEIKIKPTVLGSHCFGPWCVVGALAFYPYTWSAWHLACNDLDTLKSSNQFGLALSPPSSIADIFKTS